MKPIARNPQALAAEAARLQAENAKLNQPVETLTALVHRYEAQFRLARARAFGPAQERSDLTQLRLFNEAAQTASETSETVTVTRKKKKTPGQRDANLATCRWNASNIRYRPRNRSARPAGAPSMR